MFGATKENPHDAALALDLHLGPGFVDQRDLLAALGLDAGGVHHGFVLGWGLVLFLRHHFLEQILAGVLIEIAVADHLADFGFRPAPDDGHGAAVIQRTLDGIAGERHHQHVGVGDDLDHRVLVDDSLFDNILVVVALDFHVVDLALLLHPHGDVALVPDPPDIQIVLALDVAVADQRREHLRPQLGLADVEFQQRHDGGRLVLRGHDLDVLGRVRKHLIDEAGDARVHGVMADRHVDLGIARVELLGAEDAVVNVPIVHLGVGAVPLVRETLLDVGV